jgi:hypothetical protein
MILGAEGSVCKSGVCVCHLDSSGSRVMVSIRPVTNMVSIRPPVA